ncbi:hypothetical protein SOVF_199550, partial [Spinacia oleracea]
LLALMATTDYLLCLLMRALLLCSAACSTAVLCCVFSCVNCIENLGQLKDGIFDQAKAPSSAFDVSKSPTPNAYTLAINGNVLTVPSTWAPSQSRPRHTLLVKSPSWDTAGLSVDP